MCVEKGSLFLTAWCTGQGGAQDAAVAGPSHNGSRATKGREPERGVCAGEGSPGGGFVLAPYIFSCDTRALKCLLVNVREGMFAVARCKAAVQLALPPNSKSRPAQAHTGLLAHRAQAHMYPWTHRWVLMTWKARKYRTNFPLRNTHTHVQEDFEAWVQQLRANKAAAQQGQGQEQQAASSPEAAGQQQQNGSGEGLQIQGADAVRAAEEAGQAEEEEEDSNLRFLADLESTEAGAARLLESQAWPAWQPTLASSALALSARLSALSGRPAMSGMKWQDLLGSPCWHL
eukprot:1149083-Pelagomonas_calceolata.AAC.4